ncbi:MAG: hypothetical protein GY941_28990 [Planctomycetes bacterium]|nr:hypothetical protein [Planctomycetota bacterium]
MSEAMQKGLSNELEVKIRAELQAVLDKYGAKIAMEWRGLAYNEYQEIVIEVEKNGEGESIYQEFDW